MKRHIFILLTLLLSAVPLLAQYSPCFEAKFAEGKRLYSSGKYNQAKQYFNEAKTCPDPNTAEADKMIGKCNKAIADAAQKKKEEEAAKTAYMDNLRVDYCNVGRNGRMINGYGADFYHSKMECLQPRITYNALLEETKEPTIYIKVKNPSDILITGKNPPSDKYSTYTYSATIRVTPGKDQIISLPTWEYDTVAFSPGKYKFELWFNGNLIHASSFVINRDPKKPVPPAPDPPAPVEKKAEVTVLGADGTPLKGAKLYDVYGRKYEYTNSDGVGKIEMSGGYSKTILVTHPDYKDIIDLEVYAGDKKRVVLYQPNMGNSIMANVAGYVVPGLGRLQLGYTAEGIATLGGEVVLLGGGLVSNSIAKKQLKVMQNDNVSLADFQSAKKKYNTQRTINVICYSSAALLYGFHLYRTFIILPSIGKSGKRLSLAPTVMTTENEMALGMSINLTF